MTITVSPNSERNTHHIKLSDGSSEMGLILCNADGVANPRAFTSDPIQRQSIKMYTGEQALSDLEPPWTDVVIDDFSGGRGSEEYEADTTKYWDGRQIDTTNLGAILAPMEIFDKGTAIKAHNMEWSIHSGYTFPRKPYTSYGLYGTTAKVAASFVASSAYTPKYLYFYGKKVGSPSSSTITVYIYGDASGVPDDTITPVEICEETVTLTEELRLIRVTLSATALTSSATYWVVWYGTGADDATNHKMILCNGDSKTELVHVDGMGSWIAGTNGLPYFRVEEWGTGFRGHFAELKGSLYCGAEYMSTAVSKVFQCGMQGAATAATTATITDTVNSAIIGTDLHNGAILRIVDGTGHHVPSPWRVISASVDSSSQMAITPAWEFTPDTTSVYAVVASDRWVEVTGHGLTGSEYITDGLGINGAIYWPCGPGTNMVRLRSIAGSGTYWNWTEESGKGTFIKRLTIADTDQVWLANRTLPAQIQKASALDCTGTATVTSLSFTAMNCGNLGDKVTGLCVYGEETPELYVFKEASVHRVYNGVPLEMRIGGYNSAADERNGYANVVNDVYLYFTFLDSIERYYSGSLDDIGPNKDGGIPTDRRGMISSMVAYPGIVYASIDGGSDNYSSIIAWNGQGWHEIWRAPVTGSRIYGNLYIQPVPGDNADRLYFTWAGNIISLCVMTNPYNHNTMTASTSGFQYYAYCPGGSIETAWVHFGLKAVDKLFNSITVHGRNLSSSYSRVFADYKLDDDTAWTQVGQFTITNDYGKLYLDDATHNVTGKRIRVRIRLETLYNNSTPRLDAILIEGMATVPSKQKITFNVRIEDQAMTLLEGVADDTVDADTKIALLRTWAASAGTVAMSGHLDELNGLRVKLDYPSVRDLKYKVMEVNQQKQNRYICQIGAWVVD